jgi:hypothetical protein
MSDVYVLSMVVFNGIIHQVKLHSHYHIGMGLCSDCSKSPKGLPHPKQLRTLMAYDNILGLDGG